MEQLVGVRHDRHSASDSFGIGYNAIIAYEIILWKNTSVANEARRCLTPTLG
jgi:hypothetical protein